MESETVPDSDHSRNAYPAGTALWMLAGPDSASRVRASNELRRRARPLREAEDYYGSLRVVLEEEWSALGRYRPFVWAPLATAFREEPAMITMEVIAMALALEGEDGLTEIISLLKSDDFVFRHKAAVGLGALDKRARWAVPVLAAALHEEPQPLIVCNLIQALGRIGGREALDILEPLYSALRSRSDKDDWLLTNLEEALSHARLS